MEGQRGDRRVKGVWERGGSREREWRERGKGEWRERGKGEWREREGRESGGGERMSRRRRNK